MKNLAYVTLLIESNNEDDFELYSDKYVDISALPVTLKN